MRASSVLLGAGLWFLWSNRPEAGLILFISFLVWTQED